MNKNVGTQHGATLLPGPGITASLPSRADAATVNQPRQRADGRATLPCRAGRGRGERDPW
jgi:hypothetical protein